MLTIVTPTGARPAAFALCRRMMARQDYRGRVIWIVVDDCEPAQEPTLPPAPNWQVLTVRPYPLWEPERNTQGRNLLAALALAEAHAIEGGYDLRLTVVEDDDWYAPGWLTRLDAALDHAELVGERFARYYNVARRIAATLGNDRHASLRCTGMRGRAIKALQHALAEFSPYYDRKLWRDAAPTRALFDSRLTVGMKGLPGRPGIAEGHQTIEGVADRSLCVLRDWIGADADLYEEFFREDLMKDAIRLRARRPYTYQSSLYGTRRLVAGDVFHCEPRHERLLLGARIADAVQESESDDSDSDVRAREPARKKRQDRKHGRPIDDKLPADMALPETTDDWVTE